MKTDRGFCEFTFKVCLPDVDADTDDRDPVRLLDQNTCEFAPIETNVIGRLDSKSPRNPLAESDCNRIGDVTRSLRQSGCRQDNTESKPPIPGVGPFVPPLAAPGGLPTRKYHGAEPKRSRLSLRACALCNDAALSQLRPDPLDQRLEFVRPMRNYRCWRLAEGWTQGEASTEQKGGEVRGED